MPRAGNLSGSRDVLMLCWTEHTKQQETWGTPKLQASAATDMKIIDSTTVLVNNQLVYSAEKSNLKLI